MDINENDMKTREKTATICISNLGSSTSPFNPTKANSGKIDSNKPHISLDFQDQASMRKTTSTLNNRNKYFLVKSTNFSFPKLFHEEDRKLSKQYFIARNFKEINNDNKIDNWKHVYFMLKIIEKSIFYFNQKRYRECYDLLTNEKL